MKVSIRNTQRALLVISFLALALFLALSLNLDSRSLSAIDDYLLIPVPAGASMGRQLLWLITILGSDYVLGAALLLTAIILSRLGMFPEMLTAIVLGVSAKLSELSLKALFHRSRPMGISTEIISGYSFPSGHSLNTLAIYGVVLLLLVVNVRGAFLKLFILLPGSFLLFMIGASRVALGLHWPSDVIGGWLLGAFLLATGFFLRQTFAGQSSQQNSVMRQI